MAHEVRNPLSSALSALSFVREAASQRVSDPGVRDDLMADIEIVQNSLDYIDDLLRNMTDVHRTDELGVSPCSRLTNVKKDILEPCRTIVSGRRGDRDIDLRVLCSDSLWVEVDPLRVERIILNIALNATKFVPPGGFIQLRADVVKDSVCLYVEDSGPGIFAGHRNRLFERDQESLDVVIQGTGIGLYICKSLSEAIGADIWLDEAYQSEIPGCPGARFIVDLHLPPESSRMRPTSPCQVHDGTNFIADSTEDSLETANDQQALPVENRGIHAIRDEEATFPDLVEDDVLNVADFGTGPTNASSAVSPAAARALPLLDASPRISQFDKARPISEKFESCPNSEGESLNENVQEQNLEFPASPRQRDPPSSSSHHHSELPDHLSVLFVDDDRTLRKLFCRSVKRIRPNWTVDEAPNGEAALEVVRSRKYDLIFMDQYMESTQVTLNGTECVRLMRVAGVASTICGLSANEVEDQFMAAGADSFLLKPFPFERESLQKALSHVLYSR
jgi:CheY-like chemotaxis protein